MNAETKLGPLPIWVWGVIIGVIGLGWAWYGNATKTATTAATRTTGITSSDALDTMYAKTSGSTYVDPDSVDLATNLEWLAKTVAATADQYGLSRLDVQSA